jgi:hypothetical protein
MKDEFQPGAWTLGKHYRWIDPIAIVWVFFISIVFLMPPYSISAPWKDGFTWEAVNYAPILVGGEGTRAWPYIAGTFHTPALKAPLESVAKAARVKVLFGHDRERWTA